MRTATTAIAPPRTTARRLGVVVVALLTLLTTVLQPAAADAGFESSFVQKVNAERAAQGLPQLRVASDLVAVARRHSQRMADSDHLHHNPNLGSEVSGWKLLGENVGKGASVDSLHSAFMASPGHRANIVHTAWTEIGVGVVVVEGRIWVTQVFRQPTEAAPEPAPSSEPAPTTEPAQPAEPAPAPTASSTPTPQARATAAAATAPSPAPVPGPTTAPASPPSDPDTGNGTVAAAGPAGLGRLAVTLAQVDDQDAAVEQLLAP